MKYNLAKYRKQDLKNLDYLDFRDFMFYYRRVESDLEKTKNGNS